MFEEEVFLLTFADENTVSTYFVVAVVLTDIQNVRCLFQFKFEGRLFLLQFVFTKTVFSLWLNQWIHRLLEAIQFVLKLMELTLLDRGLFLYDLDKLVLLLIIELCAFFQSALMLIHLLARLFHFLLSGFFPHETLSSLLLFVRE